MLTESAKKFSKKTRKYKTHENIIGLVMSSFTLHPEGTIKISAHLDERVIKYSLSLKEAEKLVEDLNHAINKMKNS